MPAIAPPAQTPVVVVWDMPFATSQIYTFDLFGDSSKKTAKEGVQAIRRFRNSILDEMSAVTTPQTCMIDPLASADDLRAYALSQGVDLDVLMTGAARHFSSPTITRRTEPLNQEELESWFEDDQRALDR